MRNRPPTVRTAGIPALCVILLTLGAFLAAHTLIGTSTTCAAGSQISAHCGEDRPDSLEHGPGDAECAASARDVASTLDTAALLLVPATGGQEFPSAFHRTTTALPRPALPPHGQDVLSSTCISRT
ncbi:hypothetical protein SAMN02982929_02206 [Saccharopolyspora kobensis]|uniref:Uncharacterized protein n=1 Tax=Saccharopolyspora kobensis TaxID=146035 RepID=A0A1H6A8N3_9PSEU|nr:hypothetical protein [Saccharopolyspora kobensis]SEG45113.1 hypothetical protein SAMN02982929_02206 [Saccharopolyspora kobensis]SFE52576.1 hypothetical protein SAMN05216506_11240 [Saccharopolyspora kobensis]